ncbi:hypothetical protein BDV26DRAFT_257106 [Aspergillus bertholletiae]|uniref:Secreted protein n=1 Tax=Aspergillus bertholletiae TaxID=1226010 RepID=A0A5N7BFY3_9EURO|nr:hypothetical protein BDV26DRAFT_257106 [Aspergillus bertholletiae]
MHDASTNVPIFVFVLFWFVFFPSISSESPPFLIHFFLFSHNPFRLSQLSESFVLPINSRKSPLRGISEI